MIIARHRFLALAAGGVASIPLALRSAKAAEFQYKYHHQLTVDSPMHVRLVQLWNEVKQATGGRLVVEIFPNSELGSDAAVQTEIRAGAVQFASLASAPATALIPSVGILGIGFAFKSQAAALAAIDGKLGDAIRRDVEAKGFHVVARQSLEIGLKQVTTSPHPINGPGDLAGLKMRVAPSRLVVELFRAMGANPTPVDFAQTYTALQTHLVDGTETPVSVVDASRFFEVQRYLSMTNHSWGGYWMIANPEAWAALPDDIRRIVDRLAPKYVTLERRDVAVLNNTLIDKFTRLGMTVNQTDAKDFRVRLEAYYAHWKSEFGPTLWGLLEEYSGGKLA